MLKETYLIQAKNISEGSNLHPRTDTIHFSPIQGENFFLQLFSLEFTLHLNYTDHSAEKH